MDHTNLATLQDRFLVLEHVTWDNEQQYTLQRGRPQRKHSGLVSSVSPA